MTLRRTRGTSRQRRQQGVALVELAVCVPLLVTLVFGCIELGGIINSLLTLGHAAEEGVRRATVGATATEVQSELISAMGTLHTGALGSESWYRQWGGTVWGSWLTLIDQDDENIAASGDQIRIALTYDHRLLTGKMFARLADDPGGATIRLTVSRTMRRE